MLANNENALDSSKVAFYDAMLSPVQSLPLNYDKNKESLEKIAHNANEYVPIEKTPEKTTGNGM